MKCFYCGDDELCELLEVWSTREFTLACCCEGMQEEANAVLRDPLEAPAFMAKLGLDAVGGSKVRRLLGQDEGSMLLDWNPRVEPITQAAAKAFVREHHAHCPPPAGWRYGAGLWNGFDLIGVVMVGRPVARAIDQARVVEVNRLCVRRDLTPGVTWNACSMLYGWAAREAKARGFTQIITYTMHNEPGTTLRAAGWAQDYSTKPRAGSWHCSARPRTNRAPTVAKVRWSRQLQGATA